MQAFWWTLMPAPSPLTLWRCTYRCGTGWFPEEMSDATWQFNGFLCASDVQRQLFFLHISELHIHRRLINFTVMTTNWKLLFLFTFADLSSSGWCELAYWELNERVGSRVPVEDSAVDVFSEQTRGAGLCIRTLAKQRSTKTPDAVLRTREKIGLGELCDEGCKWIFVD